MVPNVHRNHKAYQGWDAVLFCVYKSGLPQLAAGCATKHEKVKCICVCSSGGLDTVFSV